MGDGPGPTALAGWYDDPATRHETRYWDGQAWSQHVTDAGLPAVDQIEAAWPAPSATTSGLDVAAVTPSLRSAGVPTRRRSRAVGGTVRRRDRLVAGALVATGVAAVLLIVVGLGASSSGPDRSIRRAAVGASADGGGRDARTAAPVDDGGCATGRIAARACIAGSEPPPESPRLDAGPSGAALPAPAEPGPAEIPSTGAPTPPPTTTSPRDPNVPSTTVPTTNPPADPVSLPSDGKRSPHRKCVLPLGGGTSGNGNGNGNGGCG
jgi:hypothetical protein